MAYSGNGPTLEPPRDKSRTENEMARIKSITQDVRASYTRLNRIAIQLGYFSNTPQPPVSVGITAQDPTNLVDCINELRDEVNAVGGLLNVFD